MSNERRQEKALDAALDGGTPDEETQPLVDTASRVKQTLAVDVPPADRQRALFLSGVAARERAARFSPLRVLVPALAIAIVTFAAVAGQNALPGQSLYPVREAMNTVGIGRSPIAEVDDHCEEAVRLIERAEDSLDEDPEGATTLALRAIQRLGPARSLLPELNGEREDWVEWVEDLEDDAIEIIVEASEEQEESSDESSGPGSDESGSDDSGSGSDNSGSGSDDSGGDDSSGPGSDDSDGDDSGSGSDNSGSGSDDSGGDSSGSGSDGSGGDSSGSGSDGSDSDSGGSGSGSYDDSSGSG